MSITKQTKIKTVLVHLGRVEVLQEHTFIENGEAVGSVDDVTTYNVTHGQFSLVDNLLVISGEFAAGSHIILVLEDDQGKEAFHTELTLDHTMDTFELLDEFDFPGTVSPVLDTAPVGDDLNNVVASVYFEKATGEPLRIKTVNAVLNKVRLPTDVEDFVSQTLAKYGD